MANWNKSINHFVLVFPRDYRNALAKLKTSTTVTDPKVQKNVDSNKVSGHRVKTPFTYNFFYVEFGIFR